MNRDLAGLILSIALIGLTFLASYLVSHAGCGRRSEYSTEVARKIVHIGVSNWFFIYYYIFDSFWIPLISLSAVAVINVIVNKSGGFGVLMGQKSEKRNWGLVHYPISIIIMMILVREGLGTKVALGCGLIGMGYGDGLAAIMGMRFGIRHINRKSQKTWIGFMTMFIVVTVTTFTLSSCMGFQHDAVRTLLVSILTGAVASVIEAFTPFGLDNITVPLAIFFLVGLI